MSQEEIRDQKMVFEEAMESAANEISEDMFGWDFSKMLEGLRQTIKTVSPYPRDMWRSTRHFARKFLAKEGEKFQHVIGWLNGQSMTADDIRLVLVTLNRIANGTLRIETPQEIPQESSKEISEEENFSEVGSSGAARKLIDHTITISNSLAGLVIETGVKPSDVYDGDRMQICDALKHICRAFGIKAVFPEPDMARSQRITRDDLRNLGLRTPKRRKSI